MATVFSYGQSVRDSWASYGLFTSEAGVTSVIASFTHDIAEHREALLAQVENPEALQVCRAVMSERDGAALWQQLVTDLAGTVSSVGSPGFDGRVIVKLFSNQETLAADLLAQFDDRVRLSVGLFPYPMPDMLPESQCDELPAGNDGGDLTLTIDGDAGPFSAHDATSFPSVQVTASNRGDAPIRIEHGYLTAVLVDLATRRQVSVREGGSDDVAFTLELGPGESEVVEATVGLASCDPSVGYTVPPGHYDIVVDLGGARSLPHGIDITA